MARQLTEEEARNCFTCQARDRNEWCVLTDDELKLIDKAKITREYLPGEVIFQEGEPCNGVHCIENGLVCTRKLDAAGNEILLHLDSPGDTLGYRSLLLGSEYATSAEALDTSVVCFIDAPTVHKLLQHNPTLGLRFLKHATDDLDDAEEKIMQTATQPARMRFAHLLLVLKDRYGTITDSGAMTLELPLSRHDMASMIGIRPESMSRTIKTFQDEGVATFSQRTVYVESLERLLDELEAAAI